MEAATDSTRPATSAQASSPNPRDERGSEPYRQEAGTILLAATPIGDVRDASPRVVAALEGADIVAAEDTRRALALASRLGIKLGGRLIALHDHNEAEKAAGIVEAARGGARVVFVSDAGMPTVSDPGFRLACAAIDAGVPLSVLPGPSAPLVALALSGLPSDRFAFEGFLPRKDGEATRYLQDLATDPHTLIFFESPRRAAATLSRMAEVLGGEVGASRAAVDAGFTEHARQIGQTGVTIRPKLYIACGISGQIQHTAGMDQSSMIISINTDPDAPINKIADFAITGDLNEVIPKMIKYYKQNSK